MTNLVIKLIHSVADVVNMDTDLSGNIKMVFLPDFDLYGSRWVCAAADLSEQISMAGREIPGILSLQFGLNGALTIGTPGGINSEIHEAVGEENFFLFGMHSEEITRTKELGYNPQALYQEDQELKEAIDLIQSGFFSKSDPQLFKPLVDSLLCRDEHMVLADYRSYVECQEKAGTAFVDRERWTKMSVLNVARMCRFSSDREIYEYNQQIWHATPLKTEIEST